jgi:hypothetical protein
MLVYRGKWGEPYCSIECWKVACADASRAVLKGIPGQCHFCHRSVYAGFGVAVIPYKPEMLFVCSSCTNKAGEYVALLEECCKCKASLLELAELERAKLDSIRKVTEQHPDGPAIEFLATMVTDASFEVRCAAVRALGKSSDTKAIDLIVERLENDANTDVQSDAVVALTQSNDERTIDPLVRFTKSPKADRYDVERIALFLATHGDTRAVKLLLQRLSRCGSGGYHEGVVRETIAALEKFFEKFPMNISVNDLRAVAQFKDVPYRAFLYSDGVFGTESVYATRYIDCGRLRYLAGKEAASRGEELP